MVCRFPGVPAVFFCHDFSAWHDTPPIHSRVLHYVAVDQTCKQRLLECHGLAEQSVSVIYNSVDLEKFKR
ncbi:MAG: hypothetical protein COA78_16670 [Blastopirellula sp.]|nr:MAG: hypothetical protein COA78_16670 [Blastopirellula sp.]